MDIQKLLILLILAAVLSVILKQHKAEYALFISIAAGIIVLLFAAEKVISSATLLQSKIEGFGIKGEYFSVAIKALGISFLSSFIADLCHDCGQISLADKALIAGKCAIFVLCVPLSLNLLDTVIGFL